MRHRMIKSSEPDDEVHHPPLAPGAVSFLTDFVNMATSRLLDNETLHFSIHGSTFSTGDIFDDDIDDLYVNIVVPPLPTSPSPRTHHGRNWTWPDKPFSPDLGNTGTDAALDHELMRRPQHLDVLSAELDPQTSMIDVWTPHVVFRVATISVLMALTLLGNVSLIAVIGGQPSLRRKRVSVFLVNLAVGDLMVCFVTMTTEILFVAFGQWVLGAVACKLIVYGQIVTLASTTFLLTAMSIDRYQVLVQPLKSLGGTGSVWRKVLVSWLLALVFAVPQLFIFVQTEETTTTTTVVARQVSLPSPVDLERPTVTVTRTTLECKSVGYTQEWWQRKVYFAFLTTYILVIPTAIMTYCYSRIIKAVWLRASTNGGGLTASGVGGCGGTRQQMDIDAPRIHFVTARKYQEVHQQQRGRQQVGSDRLGVTVPARLAVSSKRKVVKMTMSVIVGFVVCWTPYFVVSLVRIYSDYAIRLDMVLSVSELMALGHSALNPLLYIVFSTRTVRATCQSLRKRRANRRHHQRRDRRRQTEGDDASSGSSPRTCCCRWMSCCRSADDEETSHHGARRRDKRDFRLTSKTPRLPGIVTPPSTSESDPPIAVGHERGEDAGSRCTCCCDGDDDGCGIQRILCGGDARPADCVAQTNDKADLGVLDRRHRPMVDRHHQLQQHHLKRRSRAVFVSTGQRQQQQQQQLGAKSSTLVVQQPTTSSSSATANRRVIWTSSSGPGDNSFRRNTTTITSSTTTGRPRRATSTSAPPGIAAGSGAGTELNVLRWGGRDVDRSRGVTALNQSARGVRSTS